MDKENQNERELIRETISQIPETLDHEPSTWFTQSARYLLNFQNQILPELSPEIQSHFQKNLDLALNELHSLSQNQTLEKDPVKTTENILMKISMEMAKPFEKKEMEISENFLPLNDLISNFPDRFNLTSNTVNGVDCYQLQVRHPSHDQWQCIPLPKNHQIWHKGGPARAVLDIIAKSPISMQESEFPWHDYDVITTNNQEEKNIAKLIGVDADGIEPLDDNFLNFTKFCYGRDTQQNQVCLGADGLHFSDEALKSAQTGHVNIIGEYVANKAIYGIDKMTIQGISLAKQRGLMRLVKAVAEGKALSFDYLPLNKNFDMGVYTLFLSKRWSKKQNLPELLQKMYYLLEQMGQVKPQEHNIFNVLERSHLENPFFDFDSEVRTPLEVVRWKSRKIIKQIDREMGWKFNLPSSLQINREPNDLDSKIISLAGLQISNEDKHLYPAYFNAFLERARHRTKQYQATNPTYYEQIFNNSQNSSDELGVNYDDSIIVEQL